MIEAKVILTEDQERGLKELQDWWNLPRTHPNYYNCVFTAAAGCGKTFLAKYFTKKLHNVYPLFTATTNEAVRQLELTGLSGVRTTHSALGLVPCISQEKTTFIQSRLPDCLAECNLLIIDEASMASMAADDSQEDLIINYVNRLGMRTLWLGDWYQLPPVESNNGISPIFDQGYATVELTQVVRNKGAILEFCTALRAAIDSPVKRLPRVPKEVESITYPAFYKMLKDAEFIRNVRKGICRIIVWRNVTADRINQAVRVQLHGEELAKSEAYLPNDQILFIAPLIVGLFPADPDRLIGNKELKIGASINSKAEIISVSKKLLYSIDCYYCRVRVEGGIEQTAWIPTKAGSQRLTKLKAGLMKSIAEKKSSDRAKEWEKWHTFYNCFSKVKHSYCITTHRSQGSTIPIVVVDVIDILMNAARNSLEAYKMLYTAASRASEKLYLIRN